MPLSSRSLLDELGLRQVVDRLLADRELRRPAAGDEEVQGQRPPAAAQLAGQLEADQRPHAVAEEDERQVEVGRQGVGEGLDQRLEVGERLLAQPALPAGELHRADLDVGRQRGRPAAVDRGPAARIGEAEHAQARARVGLAVGEPPLWEELP